MKRQMATLVVSWLMIVALIAPFRVVHAQSRMVLKSSFSGFCHIHPNEPGCSRHAMSRNTFASVYPLTGSTFPANASSGCNFTAGAWTTNCNNLKVRFSRPGETSFAEIAYASPTQINIIPRYDLGLSGFGTGVRSYIVDVLDASNDGVSHSILQGTGVTYGYGVVPHGDYNAGKFCQRADIYASDSSYIQFAGGCSAFPRLANGQTTIAQLYISGVPDAAVGSEYRVKVKVNGNVVANCQQAFNAGNNGWFVTNVQPLAGWLSGDNTVQISLQRFNPLFGTCDTTDQETNGLNEIETAILNGQ